jgi:hypothetical protein
MFFFIPYNSLISNGFNARVTARPARHFVRFFEFCTGMKPGQNVSFGAEKNGEFLNGLQQLKRNGGILHKKARRRAGL